MERKYQYIHKILPAKIDNQFVAFLDVMGFSNLVSQNNLEQLDRYFFHVNEILGKLKETNPKIDFISISDSIIIVSPDGAFGLKLIIQTIKKIQLRLLLKRILLRGALAYGPVFFDNTNNILVGKGYIKAYKLESQAIYPRVIIDPSIVALLSEDRTGFIKTMNKDEGLIYKNSGTSIIKDDAIFINYGEIVDNGKIHRTVKEVYDMIKNNLYADQSIFEKYIWIKSYYLESLQKVETESLHYNTKRAIEEWIEKFSRL